MPQDAFEIVREQLTKVAGGEEVRLELYTTINGKTGKAN